MKILACYNLLLHLNCFYITSLFVYKVFQVVTTVLNAQVHIIWEAAHFFNCFFWNVEEFFSYCLFECI